MHQRHIWHHRRRQIFHPKTNMSSVQLASQLVCNMHASMNSQTIICDIETGRFEVCSKGERSKERERKRAYTLRTLKCKGLKSAVWQCNCGQGKKIDTYMRHEVTRKKRGKDALSATAATSRRTDGRT